MTFSPGPASFIRGPKSASPSNTRGGSRVPEWGPLGSVRGALSNERPYRDLRCAKERIFSGIAAFCADTAKSQASEILAEMNLLFSHYGSRLVCPGWQSVSVRGQ